MWYLQCWFHHQFASQFIKEGLPSPQQHRSEGYHAGQKVQEIPFFWNFAYLCNWRSFYFGCKAEEHMSAGVTLSYKCLAGVEENLTALHNHALNCQVLPDVFGLTHFIVHDSREKRRLVCHVWSIQTRIGLKSYFRCLFYYFLMICSRTFIDWVWFTLLY